MPWTYTLPTFTLQSFLGSQFCRLKFVCGWFLLTCSILMFFILCLCQIIFLIWIRPIFGPPTWWTLTSEGREHVILLRLPQVMQALTLLQGPHNIGHARPDKYCTSTTNLPCAQSPKPLSDARAGSKNDLQLPMRGLQLPRMNSIRATRNNLKNMVLPSTTLRCTPPLAQ